MEKYDNIFIGFGQGPKVLANTFRKHGESVLSIEADRARYGGTCFTEGCIPSKELLFLSKQDQNLLSRESYRRAILEKERTVESLQDYGYHMIADGGTKIINGTGSFVDNHHVKVVFPDGNNAIYEGKRIIINTGSVPVMADIKGLSDSRHVYDSKRMMDEGELPERLVIIGAGAIGLEFAEIYSNFGSKVTLIESASEFMSKSPRFTANAVRKDLESHGVRIVTGAVVEDIHDTESGTKVSATLRGDEPILITADAVLVATGRKPNISGLNLEKTDINVENGQIVHNDHLETDVANIFVEGDVKGGPQLTSISLSDNRIITDYVYGGGEITVNGEQAVFPRTIFLNTPLSTIGMSVDEARKSNQNIGITRMLASDTLRARITGNNDGFMEILVDLETKKIVGSTLYIEHSEEMINLVALVIREQLPYTALVNLTYSHPVSGEMFAFMLSDIKPLD
ncbi:FAD-dependent oxidoreductase [Furfurilactobacillus sp. WILCCON 0119]